MEQRGLADALTALALPPDPAVAQVDELRLGLVGTTRRRWGRRGTKIVPPIPRRYEWVYLVLAVDGAAGRWWWQWQATMKADDLLPTLTALTTAWPLDGMVWDGAGSHRAKRLSDLPLPRLILPPYSPELNPAERVFEAVRRHVEGVVSATLADKQAVVAAYLQELAADPQRVRTLAGWDWILSAAELHSIRSMS